MGSSPTPRAPLHPGPARRCSQCRRGGARGRCAAARRRWPGRMRDSSPVSACSLILGRICPIAGSEPRRPPRWLKHANRINVALLRRGIGPSSQRLLSVPGRVTGVRRTTPVAIVSIDRERYIVAGYETSDWVKNARAAGWAIVSRGKTSERVTLTEVAADKCPSILQAFARQVRGGRSFLTVAADTSDADFVKASLHHPVFRMDRRSSA